MYSDSSCTAITCKRSTLNNPATTPPGLSSCSGALTIELDLQDPAYNPVPPAPLDRETAAAVSGRIAADLNHILQGIDHLAMVVPGALYDQTELLRPGFPLLRTLEDLFRGGLRNTDFSPQIMALGANRGYFPVPELNPERRPNSGPLLLLPFILIGRRRDLLPVATTMENTLLQQGEVSPATRDAVQSAFGLRAASMSYATIGDLCALLQVQLENAGFTDLWRLLEHALFQRAGVLGIRLDSGNRYLLADGKVYAPFYTFDAWAQLGPGRTLAAGQLGAAYGEWLRAQRQYTLTLAAYGLEIKLVLGYPELEQDDAEAAFAAAQAVAPLEGDILLETVMANAAGAPERHLLITNQFERELGALAYTVLALDGNGRTLSLEHLYPLRPEGLRQIIEQLRHRGAAAGVDYQVLHPPTLVYSATGRCLESARP